LTEQGRGFTNCYTADHITGKINRYRDSRLSGFNDADTPEYRDVDGGIGLGDFDMGPDGKTIVAKMRPGRGQESTVVIVFDF
jgi:hypothetical protein